MGHIVRLIQTVRVDHIALIMLVRIRLRGHIVLVTQTVLPVIRIVIIKGVRLRFRDHDATVTLIVPPIPLIPFALLLGAVQA